MFLKMRLMGVTAALIFGLLVSAAASAAGLSSTMSAASSHVTTIASNAELGGKVYAQHCASCHSIPQMGHITGQAQEKSANYVYDVVSHGVMRGIGGKLTHLERQAVSEYMTGMLLSKSALKDSSIISPTCSAERSVFNASDLAYLRWGGNKSNLRSVAGAGVLAPSQVRRLKPKWVVAFPEATYVRSQPTAAGGAIYVGSHNGTVYALDQETGCTRWQFKAKAEVRSAITIVVKGDADKLSARAYFADRATNAYALNAETGELIWERQLDQHPTATVTGSVSEHKGQLFVPISSIEDAFAMDPQYPCCTHQGSLISLDAGTGKILWRGRTIDQNAKEVGFNAIGTPIWAPSGASVWNTPAVDTKRARLYVGTSNNHSWPAKGNSDSVVAFDMKTGEKLWAYQGQANDAWNSACMPDLPTAQNCPDPEGPDTDFGTSPMLVEVAEKTLIVAGQKSGMLHAIDPDSGQAVWKKRVVRGGWLDGIHFGMASQNGVLYVPSADTGEFMRDDLKAMPGLFALAAKDGTTLWANHRQQICSDEQFCEAGISAPPMATPDVVYVATLEGTVYAFDAHSGGKIWSFDTTTKLKTLAGMVTRGGGIAGAAGPLMANGRLFVSSGYGFYGTPGNAFIAFEPEPEY